jgi:predicted alpha-1,2-mannosidase
MRRGQVFILVFFLVLGSCDDDGGEPPVVERPLFCPGSEDLAALVDPMIGTSGSGNAIPAALVPHGMVRLGPDTLNDPGAVDAYEYRSDRIEGFTHTNLHGPGGSANGYSQILVMPTTGPLALDEEGYSSAFSHETEEASPGFYAVTLDDTGVRAELTAGGHAGYHRYTFPAGSESARVLIDLGHSLGISQGGEVRIEGDRVLRGFGEYNVHPGLDFLLSTRDSTVGDSTVYFYARFDPPFSESGTWSRDEANEGSREAEGRELGAWAGWGDFGSEQVVEVRVGISLVSDDGARRNLEAEIGDLSFDQVRQSARDRWNCHLNRVVVEGGSEAERTMFYTALYHSLFQPADHTEADGRFFSGADGRGEVFRWTDRRFYTDDWCAWDTFRTSRPLATLVEADRVGDVVGSYLHLYQQGGWLPKCTWQATGYSRVMIGNHGLAIIADAAVKGLIHPDDEALAWEALEQTSTEDNSDRIPDMLCGYFDLGTRPEYRELGYVTHECDAHQSASMTLEIAYNDWAVSQAARSFGLDDQADRFLERSGNWRNHWDESTGFMRGRLADGSWVEPFDPTDGRDDNDFCEATSWIYTWFVPHDVPALIDLMGGEAPFIERLDQFFDEGHFELSNEPSFHVPFLYIDAGAPERTQEVTREVLTTAFSADPSGLPGNDDAGATSAWYVLAALGLYPVAPGDGVYHLASPSFDRLTLYLDPTLYPEAGMFVIEASGNGPGNVYVHSATLNGDPLDRWWITHEEIVSGGTLSLEMGATP